MDSIWYRGLNLSERLAASCVKPEKPDSSTQERSGHRLAEWRSQSPFQQDDWFQRRLDRDGMTDENDLLALLAESDQALARRYGNPDRWMVDLEEVFERATSSPPLRSLPVWSPDFVTVVEPLALESLDLVRAAAQRLAFKGAVPLFNAERVAEVLYDEVALWLDVIVSRVMALEIKVAKLKDELVGETPRDRYQSFINALRTPPHSLAMLREYPVLARLAVGLLDSWVDASLEFLEHLHGDWDLLQNEMFGGKDLGQVESINGGAGDRHRGGRSVKLIRFTSGFGVAYKPRSLEIDIRFAHLLTWLEERGAPELRIPRTLDRGSYGWTSLVSHASCSTREELERYYGRQGAWLALLYMLNAHDIHAENVIAAGEHPVVVDLETLFRPELWTREAMRFESAADIDFAESVMQVMLLPFLQRRGEARHVVEPSGLGGREGQLSLVSGAVWEGKFTDEIRLVRRPVEIPTSSNRPRVAGEAVDAFDFSQQIVHGFESMIRLLADLRSELLAPGGPLLAFAGAEVRVLLRPTQFYLLILSESLHPQALRDGLDRDRLFDRLWFGIDRSSRPELFLAMIPEERAALWQGDVPYLSTRVDSRDGWSTSGKRLEGIFLLSGLDIVRSRFAQLDPKNIDRQVWYIRCSLASLAWSPERELPPPYRLSLKPKRVETGDLLEKALEIGRRLDSFARRHGDEASWIGLSPVIGRGWQLRPLRTDLYSGLPGIVLFLAYLSEVTAREEPRRLAERALKALRKRIEWEAREMEHIGAFSGWGGLLFTWTHLASLWGPPFYEEAAGFVQGLEGSLAKNRDFDLSFGYAGAIVALLRFHDSTGDPKALDLAGSLGDCLVRSARPVGNGLSWLIESTGGSALTGLSHGAAGCAWALFELFAVTRQERYRDAALRGIAFENSYFSELQENWADLRDTRQGEPARYVAAWCHGATGIGLSRLRILDHHPDPDLLRDVGAAVRSTLRLGFGNNHCLCHGDFGSLELLLEASRALKDSAWSQDLDRQTSRVFASIEENGWICGLPLAVESPGLMEGLAGIGYGLLRLAAPDRVPSVLLLDPPMAASGESRSKERWLTSWRAY